MINPLDKLSHGMRARGHEERGAARTRQRRCRLAGRGARAHAADARVRPIRFFGLACIRRRWRRREATSDEWAGMARSNSCWFLGYALEMGPANTSGGISNRFVNRGP